jgi:chorismate mutase / prephenate dehydratase
MQGRYDTDMTQDQERELAELRAALDEVDDGILALLAKRATLAKKVSALRQQEGATRAFSPVRERQIIERLENKGAGDFPKRSLNPVFREILAACTALEAPMRVAYEGPPGSLAHEAARKRFGASTEYLACEGPRATLELVEREHADAAVMVLESAKEGLLQPTLDALAESELKIVDEIETDARVHLLNVTGNLQNIEKVYAAPAERAAAARFLAANLPRAQVLDTRTPVMAAQLAAEDHGAAALGGGTIAEMFGLQIARGNVSDETGEHVRCAVCSTRPSARTGRDTTAIAITLDDAPGALFRVLQPLADRDQNLRRIQSRPRAREADDSSRTYRFFLELSGHVTDRALITALEEMKRGVRQLKILGSYPSKS